MNLYDLSKGQKIILRDNGIFERKTNIYDKCLSKPIFQEKKTDKE